MSAFRDYLSMVGKGLENPSEVLKGNFNVILNGLGLLPEDQQKEAERRFAICNECPFASHNAKQAGFYQSARIEKHCTICECPLEAKVMSFVSRCGLEHLEEKKDENGNRISGLRGYKVMWEAYKTN